MCILFLGLSFFICICIIILLLFVRCGMFFSVANHVSLAYNMTKLLINYTRILCPDSLDRRMDAMEDTRE